MPGRNFASRQLLNVEDELLALASWANEMSLYVGEIADGIHFDDDAPTNLSALVTEIEVGVTRVARAAGLLRAYEIHRKSQAITREFMR